MIAENADLRIGLLLMFALVGLFLVATYGHVTVKVSASESNLFLPLPRLVYGPNTTQVTDLIYRYVEVHDYQNKSQLIIHNPEITIPSLNSTLIPEGEGNVTFKVVFDSFFILNLQEPQIIPQVSNLTVNLTRILNPAEASDITQMKLDNSITLPVSGSDGSQTSFIVPPDITSGDYLVDLFAYFPDYAVGAVYSSRVTVNVP